MCLTISVLPWRTHPLGVYVLTMTILQNVVRLQLPRRLARHPHPDMHLSFQTLLSFISLLRIRPRGFDFFFASTPRYRVRRCAYNFLTGGIFSTLHIAAANFARSAQLSCKSTGHGVRRPRGASLKTRADHMQLLLQDARQLRVADTSTQSPALPRQVLYGTVPSIMQKRAHACSFLRRCTRVACSSIVRRLPSRCSTLRAPAAVSQVGRASRFTQAPEIPCKG